MRFLISLLLFFSFFSYSEGHKESEKPSALHVGLEGNVPFEQYPELQKQSNSIWSFIKKTLNVPDTSPAPVIRFQPFENVPKSFVAFHYDNTNKIQIDPQNAFLQYYHSQYGDLIGMGFYIMGHEMMHYAFQEKNILPSSTHHCLFLLPLLNYGQSVMQVLSNFLILNHLSSQVIRIQGLRKEQFSRPCRDIKDISALRQSAMLKLTE